VISFDDGTMIISPKDLPHVAEAPQEVWLRGSFRRREKPLGDGHTYRELRFDLDP
jgi:hypothetical protein